MKMRRPRATASICKSGHVTCTGTKTEAESRQAAIRCASILRKKGYTVRLGNFRIVNVFGSCSANFAINIIALANKYKSEATYEPELHPGLTFKIDPIKATLIIFTTGCLTLTAPNVENARAAVKYIKPIILEFGKPRSIYDMEKLKKKEEAKEKKAMKVKLQEIKKKENGDESIYEDDDLTEEDMRKEEFLSLSQGLIFFSK